MALIALACHRGRNGPETVVVIDGRLYPLAAIAEAAKAKLPPQWAQGGIPALLLDWDKARAWLEPILASARDLVQSAGMTPVGEGTSTLMAPYRPERIFCAASNYVEHANEMGTVLASKAESKPYMFLKLRNTVIGRTRRCACRPRQAARLGDRACRRHRQSMPAHQRGRALDASRATHRQRHSARDLNVRGDYPFKFDWFQGKCHDTFAPLRPLDRAGVADPRPAGRAPATSMSTARRCRKIRRRT